MQKPLQPSQKPSAVCDSLCACLPMHINVDKENYFFKNQFLSLLPPLTWAQCLATKIASITKLASFADSGQQWPPSTNLMSMWLAQP